MEEEAKQATGITVELFTQDGCPMCEMAKEELTKAGINYVEIDFDSIDSRPDKLDLLASLANSGISLGAETTLPIARVLEHKWEKNINSVIEQAKEAQKLFSEHNPEYAKVVDAVLNGAVDFPAKNRVIAPEAKEWRMERINLNVKEAMALSKNPGISDPSEALDQMYVDLRQKVKDGSFSMGDFGSFVKTAYQCMARQQIIEKEVQLANDKAMDSLFGVKPNKTTDNTKKNTHSLGM